MLIKITDIQGKNYLVNPEHIIYISCEDEKGCNIGLAYKSGTIFCKSSISEVEQLITLNTNKINVNKRNN